MFYLKLHSLYNATLKEYVKEKKKKRIVLLPIVVYSYVIQVE